MVTRGVYSEDEKEMLVNFEKAASKVVGWSKSLNRKAATEEFIINTASFDIANPLWRDNDYAAGTRWGGIIAPPIFQDSIGGITPCDPVVPPSVGYRSFEYPSVEVWEFFNPIRVNDSFKVFSRSPRLEDVTSLDGNGLRKYKLLAMDGDIINQRDELNCRFKLYLELTILPEPPEKQKLKPSPEYVYTKEELEYIERVSGEEKIRGGEIRYWEEVKEGEEIGTVIMGPITMWDLIVFFAGRQPAPLIPMMEMRKRAPQALALDEETGVTHHDIEWHFSDSQAQKKGEPRSFCLAGITRQIMVRSVTNWMGDDGFIRNFEFTHNTRTYVGDTVIGRGKVVDKRIEDGKYLVDLSLWLENFRGNISDASFATVELCSRESQYRWK
jgi:hypothetical protein